MNQQQDLTHKPAEYYGMLYRIFAKNENMTVFLTTHYMEEATEADYVVIIDNGKISAEGTPSELKNIYTGDYITIYGEQEENVKKTRNGI